MKSTPVISIQNVLFAYNSIPILESVNLTIHARDFVCIVGPNGGGKTTLLKLVLGLLRPTRGTIRVFGESPQQSRSRIGYMPQYARLDTQFPVSVQDVVLMGCLGKGNVLGPYGKEDKEKAAAAMRAVGLYESRRTPLFKLSGGQQQRALIARALVSDPELLLLDEPTANLDLHVEGELQDLLRKLNETKTIILVTHDLGFVSHLVETVICVNRKVVTHPTSDLTGEMIRELYGGTVHMVRHDHQKVGENSI